MSGCEGEEVKEERGGKKGGMKLEKGEVEGGGGMKVR